MATLIRPGDEAMSTVNVGSAEVTLTRTSVTDTSINVTATISYSDAVILNGTYRTVMKRNCTLVLTCQVSISSSD